MTTTTVCGVFDRCRTTCVRRFNVSVWEPNAPQTDSRSAAGVYSYSTLDVHTMMGWGMVMVMARPAWTCLIKCNQVSWQFLSHNKSQRARARACSRSFLYYTPLDLVSEITHKQHTRQTHRGENTRTSRPSGVCLCISIKLLRVESERLCVQHNTQCTPCVL